MKVLRVFLIRHICHNYVPLYTFCVYFLIVVVSLVVRNGVIDCLPGKTHFRNERYMTCGALNYT